MPFQLFGLGPPQLVQIACTIWFISKLLTLFPNMFGKKKCKLPKGHVIGHRGSKEEGVPENTLLAFRVQNWCLGIRKLTVGNDWDGRDQATM